MRPTETRFFEGYTIRDALKRSGLTQAQFCEQIRKSGKAELAPESFSKMLNKNMASDNYINIFSEELNLSKKYIDGSLKYTAHDLIFNPLSIPDVHFFESYNFDSKGYLVIPNNLNTSNSKSLTCLINWLTSLSDVDNQYKKNYKKNINNLIKDGALPKEYLSLAETSDRMSIKEMTSRLNTLSDSDLCYIQNLLLNMLEEQLMIISDNSSITSDSLSNIKTKKQMESRLDALSYLDSSEQAYGFSILINEASYNSFDNSSIFQSIIYCLKKYDDNPAIIKSINTFLECNKFFPDDFETENEKKLYYVMIDMVERRNSNDGEN